MTLVLRVSCGLHGRVRVATSASEVARSLESLKWDVRLLDGVLHLVPGETGKASSYHLRPEKNAGDVFEMVFGRTLLPELPAFRLDQAEFQVIGPDVLSWIMPQVHTLPWPKIAQTWYSENPEHQDDLLRSLRVRLASAERAGWTRHQVLYGVPVEVRRAVGREKWAAFVKSTMPDCWR